MNPGLIPLPPSHKEKGPESSAREGCSRQGLSGGLFQDVALSWTYLGPLLYLPSNELCFLLQNWLDPSKEIKKQIRSEWPAVVGNAVEGWAGLQAVGPQLCCSVLLWEVHSDP